MMRAIVLVLCLAAAGGIAAYTQLSGGDSGEPVYTVPPRAPAVPPAPSPAAAKPVAPVDPGDRAALARALQRELKRVGCYHGEITGIWTTSSRLAMKTFNERVNASLPVDAPDPVLLSLVQGHRDRACEAACTTGQSAGTSGACMPGTALAKPGGPSAERAETGQPAAPPPAVGAAAVAGTAAALALARPAQGAKGEAKGGTPEPKASGPAAPRPAAAPPGAPVPPEGMVRERRPRRTADAPPRPPKFVRDVLRTLGFK